MAALLAGGCSTDNTEPTTQPVAGNKVAVSFGATMPETRATITMGQNDFTGAWEDTDVIGVTVGTESNVPFSRIDDLFKGELTAGTEARIYNAYYPYGAGYLSTENIASIPFGTARTQEGGKYNSQFDPLWATPIQTNGVEAGLNTDGSMIVFQFQRLTSILAFNLAGSTDQNGNGVTSPITKVVLTADQPIAADNFMYNITNGAAAGSNSSWLDTNSSNEIDLTFNGDDGSLDPNTDANGGFAYFNIPTGTYNFTLSVYTADNMVYTKTYTGIDAVAGEATGNKTPIQWEYQNGTSAEGLDISLTQPDNGNLLNAVIGGLLGLNLTPETTEIISPDKTGIVNLGAVGGLVGTIDGLINSLWDPIGINPLDPPITLDNVLGGLDGKTYVTVDAPNGIKSLKITSDNEGLVQLLDGLVYLLTGTQNVLGDSAVEDMILLKHQADVGSDKGGVVVAKRQAVQKNLPRVRLVKLVQQIDKGALAGA